MTVGASVSVGMPHDVEAGCVGPLLVLRAAPEGKNPESAVIRYWLLNERRTNTMAFEITLVFRPMAPVV